MAFVFSDLHKQAWERDGWLLIPSVIPDHDVSLALEGALTIVPSGETFARCPSDYPGLSNHEFAAMVSFPFESVHLSLTAVHSDVLSIVARLLGTENPLLYQAQLWAKYAGAVTYEQTHHRDYAKNTMLTPDGDHRRDFVEVFIYLTDVGATDGPTAFVSRALTSDLSLEPARYSRSDMPWLYDQEKNAEGPAGTLLCYAGDTFHRATELSRPAGARIGLKLAFKRPEATWVGYHAPPRIGFEPAWSMFVHAANPMQLAAVGFPCDLLEQASGLASASVKDYSNRYASTSDMAEIVSADH